MLKMQSNLRTSLLRTKCVAVCLKNLGRTLVRHLCSGSTMKSEVKEIMSKCMSQDTVHSTYTENNLFLIRMAVARVTLSPFSGPGRSASCRTLWWTSQYNRWRMSTSLQNPWKVRRTVHSYTRVPLCKHLLLIAMVPRFAPLPPGELKEAPCKTNWWGDWTFPSQDTSHKVGSC